MLSTAVMNSLEGLEESKIHNQPRLEANPRANVGEALDRAIETWLLQRYPCSSGESTALIYRKLLLSLRSSLQTQELDLDCPAHLLTPQIHFWATQRTPGSTRQGQVAASTYNQRIAAIRSFYRWAHQNGIYHGSSPTDSLSRPCVPKYAGTHALDAQQVRHQLKQIDCSTPRGQRDYALLQVALSTGRSARELASLTWGNLSQQADQLTLTFVGGRRGTVRCETLDARLSQALLAYLRTIYGEKLAELAPQAPVWISFSDRTAGQAIGQQTIADICETHLGSSRVHCLRHTYALSLEQRGTPLSAIQAQLGHGNRATTGIYLASLKGDHQV